MEKPLNGQNFILPYVENNILAVLYWLISNIQFLSYAWSLRCNRNERSSPMLSVSILYLDVILEIF